MPLFETFVATLLSLFALWLPSGVFDSHQLPELTTTALVTRVIDGDTIIVDIDGREYTVRYIGIDTPEPRREGEPECGSKEATAENRRLVEGRTIELVADSEDKDNYERLLRYVYVDGMMVNEALIRGGFAAPLTIPPNTTYASYFGQLATAAKASDSGIWAYCD